METLSSSQVVLKDLGIDWTQLTELDLFLIAIPTLAECLDILKEGVSIRQCSMNAVPVLGLSKLEPLSLLKLEHLQLKMYWQGIIDPLHNPFLVFLHSLSLPTL